MKLKELLKELQGYDIKVGARTQFLYCGECNTTTPRIISRLSNSLLKHLKENQINKVTGKPYKTFVQMINDFVPFLEREVIEVYDSCINEKEKIIKVAGMERCKYWDKEEYQRKRRKRNEQERLQIDTKGLN